MSKAVEFRLDETPLQQGVTLIEASAGTGKTFTLAGLVLRLVIEEHLRIEEILAVTYTVAATEELRDRVRARLRDALDALRRGESADPVIAHFLKNGDVPRAIRELNVAVASFDEAQIFTIHGFCQRMLGDYAFENGAMFESELLSEPRALFEEVARDFWRQRIYDASPLISRLVLHRKAGAGEWAKLLNTIRNHPGIQILPEPAAENCGKLAAQLQKKFEEIAREWVSSRDGVGVTLRESKDLSRSKSGSSFHPDEVGAIIENVSALFAGLEDSPAEYLGALETLAASHIASCTKPTGVSPQHGFFDLCEEFVTLASRFVNQLTHEFVAFAQREMPLRKAHRNAITYDDLLTQLRDTLHGLGGAVLADKMGERYKAALIDEFQDTDQIQYDIFNRAFGGGRHHLWFIGDPKQAIYGFRGADVRTYLRAAEAASRHCTLRTNFRSEEMLLRAVNTLFGDAKDPFLIEGIDYIQVGAPLKPRADFKIFSDPESAPPFRFRLLEKTGDKVPAKGAADGAIQGAVVADIVRLHGGGARRGGKPLQFRDMAVLVRNRFQARALQDALRVAGVKSVLQTDESVFQTDEAREMQRLLDGILEPGRESLLKAALATSLVGMGVAELLALDADEAAWQRQGEKVLDWRERWERDGFIAMFRRLLVTQNVRGRLVLRTGGERRLTNFLHLAELLHAEESGHHLAPDALCTWLRKQRTDDAESADEFQLRLESDEDAVLISTIHKSKGLEYPVVFCPFLWRTSETNQKRRDILFHDSKDRITLDLEKSKIALDASQQEELQESLRLLYVAITRAQNRCFVYVGAVRGVESSALGHVLGLVSQDSVFDAVEKLALKSGGSIGATVIDPVADAQVAFSRTDDAGADKLAARQFEGVVSQTAMIGSFTGLIFDRFDETGDHDALAVPAAVERRADPLAVFPPGAHTGVFFHEVFEHLDFQNAGSIESLVGQKLASNGISAPDARSAASAQIRRVIETPLYQGMTLSSVARGDRLNEVEFTFPVASLRPGPLRAAFAKHGGGSLPAGALESLDRLRFSFVEGFMRGFMDLLFKSQGKFWLIDWKTNALDGYDDAGMRGSMAQHCYYLQYHLYVVAADLFLRSRVPGYDYDKHFGGVFYIFLRGVDPAHPERGIFRARPDAELVRALRETLTGTTR